MLMKWLAAAVLAGSAVSASAADDAQKIAADALHKVAPAAKIQSVTAAAMPGFYVVVADGHPVFISVDGKYLIEGHVYDIAAHHDIMDDGLTGVRKDALAKIPANKRLIFAPPHPKYTVTVFTDVDCPYCREFHKQIAEYNKLGIAVDYVLFPLSIHPGSDKKAVSVWCSKDRNSAYTEAMDGKTLAPKTCDNPIAEITNVAMSMGVNGTPAIFANDGTQLGGYLPPQQLAQRLDALAAPAKPATAK